MKLTYIFHSGFAVSGERITLIIDYFKDSAAQEGVVQAILREQRGPLYVLCTHGHVDHFNPEILHWKKDYPDIHYIFSDDIRLNGQANAREAVFLTPGGRYRDRLVTVEAFGSTDLGVSFLIEAEDRRIFHAGDLNNWHWREESTVEESQEYENHYLNELIPIERAVSQLDLALFPVDSRLGPDYMLGAEQFIDRVPTAVFAPMHFGESYGRAAAFRTYAESHGSRFITWHYRGESIDF